MHIPDGWLDPYLAGATWLIAAVYLVFMARKIPRERWQFIAPVAGAIFVAQMLNWPIPGGTSLHFVGGAFAAVYLGSAWEGSAAIALVLAVQALLFHDGGITTYGANFINMGIVAPWVGILVYKALQNRPHISAFLAGWMSLFIAGCVAGIEIGVMPTAGYPLSVTLPAMAVPHFLLGIVEGVITSAVLTTMERLHVYAFPRL